MNEINGNFNTFTHYSEPFIITSGGTNDRTANDETGGSTPTETVVGEPTNSDSETITTDTNSVDKDSIPDDKNEIEKLKLEIAKLKNELNEKFKSESNTKDNRTEVEKYIYSDKSLTSRILKSYGIKEEK